MVYEFFEELKDFTKEKIREMYIRFKYVFLIALFIILIMLIFCCEKKEPDTVESQQLLLFGITIENWAQWITIITIPYTAGWAIYQFKKSLLAKKQEKAVEIAKEFSEDLVNKCGIINQVYQNSSLNKILKYDKKNYDYFKVFNTDELRRIYKDDNFPTKYQELRGKAIEELDEIYHYILISRVVPYNTEIFIKKRPNKHIEKEKDIDKEDKEKEKEEIENDANRFILQNSNLPYHFVDLESDVLNQLEHICMDISSKATDSNFIYQSLHQMFLRTVRTLAVEISVDNLNYSDKFYTNIIHVYNDWTTRYRKDSKIERRKKEKIDKILNPKIKTV